jgi:hypothetical protein
LILLSGKSETHAHHRLITKEELCLFAVTEEFYKLSGGNIRRVCIIWRIASIAQVVSQGHRRTDFLFK